MQETMINQEIETMDLTKVAALQQKRTIAFVNHFTITTVQFINNFAKQCEHKMMNFERKLEKINATMVLLEARLSSVPEVNTPTENIKPQETDNDASNDNNNNELEQTTSEKDNTTNNIQSPLQEEICPEYQKFVKMVHVGVPLDAVKLKLAIEGLDPKVLDQILGK